MPCNTKFYFTNFAVMNASLTCRLARFMYLPPRMMVAESDDGLLLATVQVYSPPVVTVRVCVYCAVSGSSNTVSIPSVTEVESLVQVTVVAGPPVEIQVMVSWSKSNVTSSPIIVMSPTLMCNNQSVHSTVVEH